MQYFRVLIYSIAYLRILCQTWKNELLNLRQDIKFVYEC